MKQLHGIYKQTLKTVLKLEFVLLVRYSLFSLYSQDKNVFISTVLGFHPENLIKKICKRRRFLFVWLFKEVPLIIGGWRANIKKFEAAIDRKKEEQTATLITSTGTEVHIMPRSKWFSTMMPRGLQMASVSSPSNATLLNIPPRMSTLSYLWCKLISHQDDAKHQSGQNGHLQFKGKRLQSIH